MSDISGFGLSMRITESFFDRDKVIRAVEAAERRELSRAGAFVRTRARSSIRRRKKVSQPGQPPSAHSRDNVATLKNILFAYEPERKAVVIGPVKLHQGNEIGGFYSAGTVPATLEFGGTVGIREIRNRNGTWRRRDNRRTPRPGDVFRVRKARYRPRPFMGPALAAEAPQFPQFFANSVK